MSNYLIFFGKSQDFTFYAFDGKGLIKDFNSIIKDFDKLESEYFTVDDVNNLDILAKYSFQTKNNESYSLLKLYSFAQAVNGNRVSGSTIGVAFLSKKDISVSQSNIDLLSKAKANISKLALNGLKFNKSNFLDDAFAVWEAFINYNGVSLYDKIDYSTSVIITPQVVSPRAYLVKSLFDNLDWINNETSKSQKVYITEDKPHILRAISKWGDSFPVFVRENGLISHFNELISQDLKSSPAFDKKNTASVKYDSTVNNSDGHGSKDDLSKLKVQLSDLQYEKSKLISENKNQKEKFEKANRLLRILLVTSCAILLVVLFLFLFKKKSRLDDNSGIQSTGFNEILNSPESNKQFKNLIFESSVVLLVKSSQTNVLQQERNLSSIDTSLQNIRGILKSFGTDTMVINEYCDWLSEK